MKHSFFIYIAALAFAGQTPLFAQTNADKPKTETTATPANATLPWVDAEVRKIDKDAGRITLKHGEIKNLEMPGMTMVFNVKDKSLLDTVQTGDKIKFTAISESGKYFVLDIVTPK